MLGMGEGFVICFRFILMLKQDYIFKFLPIGRHFFLLLKITLFKVDLRSVVPRSRFLWDTSFPLPEFQRDICKFWGTHQIHLIFTFKIETSYPEISVHFYLNLSSMSIVLAQEVEYYRDTGISRYFISEIGIVIQFGCIAIFSSLFIVTISCWNLS